MQLKDEELFEYTPVEWRFSAVTPSVFGLDPWATLIPPAILYGLSSEKGMFYFFVVFVFVAVVIYVAAFTKHQTIGSWLHALRTRYIQRLQWETD